MRTGGWPCVEKHLGAAAVLDMERVLGYPLHRALVIGNLSQAEEEAYKLDPQFAARIRSARVRFQSDGTEIFFEPLLIEMYRLSGALQDQPEPTEE